MFSPLLFDQKNTAMVRAALAYVWLFSIQKDRLYRERFAGASGC